MEFTGERYLPDQVDEYDISAEHIHRYSIASLCVKDKIVADIACGEGYGSFMLAENAKKVYGFDIDEETLKYAKQKYNKDNLEYCIGNICDIPLEDNSIDVLISFETIEHVSKEAQIKFISEIKRVLKDDGFFIISTPNKKVVAKNNNPYHVHELEYEEFSNLLNNKFKFISMYYQQFEQNSVISGGGNSALTLLNTEKFSVPSVSDCTFFIAVGSDSPLNLPHINSILTPGSRDIFNNHQKVLGWGNELDAIIIKQKTDLKYLYDKSETLEKENKALNENLENTQKENKALNENLENTQKEIYTLSNNITTLKENVQELESALSASKELSSNLKVSLLEATNKYENLKLEKTKNEEDSQNTINNLKNLISSLEKIVQLREFELNNIRRNKIYQILASCYKILKKIKQKLSGITSVSKNNSTNNQTYEHKTEKDELVSIIIPIYNNYDYLECCLDSAINQTYKNIEIIAVNDCSPDKRVKPLLEKYKNKYSNFHYYDNNVNQGICTTTNIAMEKSNGEWFAFLDCDDWLEETAIETLMHEIRKNSKSLFGYTNRYNYNNDTKECELVDFGCRPTKNYRENLEMGMYVSHLKIVQKSVFERIGTFDPTFDGVQDYDIALKAAFYFGDEIFTFLRKPVYYHRVHSSQTTTVQNAKLKSLTQKLVDNSKLRNAIQKGKFNKKISFIVLSFNKKDQTKECIESIYKTTKVPFEIILFDNHSNPETIEYIKSFTKSLENIKTVFSETNIGCGRGRQAALKYATGDYIVMIDNDIILTDNWLPDMIIRLESDEKVAAVSAKVVFPDNKVQFNSLSTYKDKHFITYSLNQYMVQASNLETCDWKINDWLPGGATMYKSGVLNSVTSLEEYINCYEDNETSLQLQNKGYKFINCPTAVMIHNHIIYRGNTVEKEYTQARYNKENLVKSAFAFYRRNGLIIKDNDIFNIMGLSGKSDEEIIRHFEKMLQDEKK